MPARTSHPTLVETTSRPVSAVSAGHWSSSTCPDGDPPVSHPDPVVNYRALWALPGLRLVFTAAALSPACLTPPRPVPAAHRAKRYRLLRRGRDTLGIYGITSFTMPAKARLLDTRGPRRVQPLLSTLLALTLLALALAAGSRVSVAPGLLRWCGRRWVRGPPVGPTRCGRSGRGDPRSRCPPTRLQPGRSRGVRPVRRRPGLAAALAQATNPAIALAGTAAAHLLGSLVMATSPC